MRHVPSWWWDLWDNGGPFVGSNKPCTRITVDGSQILDPLQRFLYTSPSGQNIGSYSRVPIRWFQRCDNSQLETELPNVRDITIDRNIENDAATLEFNIYNQKMLPLTGVDPGDELGQPGFYTFGRGASDDEIARWKHHEPNNWYNVLTPNTLVRTYQGYGGHDKTLGDALDYGNVILTGMWLIDEVNVQTNGIINIKCRDMAKLVIDQNLYPPLIPQSEYPMERYRWRDVLQVKDSAINIRQISPSEGISRFGAYPSGNYYWFPDGTSHGHSVAAAFDNDPGSYWLSVTNSRPDAPYAVEYIEFAIDGADINKVFVLPFLGNYRMYVSLWKNGAWIPGAGPIGYNPAGIGRYDSVIHAPYVFMTGVPFEAGQWFCLPQLYSGVDKVRLTFDNLAYDGQDSLAYRYVAGVRSMAAGSHQQYMATVDGNFKDFAEIIKDLLLWAGFWCYTSDFSLDPEVYGNIELTGWPGEDPQHMFPYLPYDWFDRKPLIDIIHQITKITGFRFWVDDEGAARFEAPNIWQWPRNYYNDGSAVHFLMPTIDERHQLITYGVDYSDKFTFGEIITANIDVYDKTQSSDSPLTVSAVFDNPMAPVVLKGLVRTTFNQTADDFPMSHDEAMTSSMLEAVRLFMNSRQGTVECVANPAIGINDQVRIFERQTAETYVHYVRGVNMRHDLETGEFKMTLTTNWMGDETSGVTNPDQLEPYLQRYFNRTQGKTIANTRLDNYFQHPTTINSPTGGAPPVIP